MMIGLVSAGGSPGVSTTAVAMGGIWPDPVVVVDADPSGGDILAGAGGVIPAERNLLELVRLGRHGRLLDVLESQISLLPSGTPVVAGLGQPGQAAGVPWASLAEGLGSVTHRDVVVDLGRWMMPYLPTPLLRACDVVLLVVRTQLRAVRRAERVLPLIRDELDRGVPGTGALGLLVVTDHGPYAPTDIGQRMQIEVLGGLPFDPRTAAVFSDGADPARHLDRSSLMRGLRPLVDTVGRLAQARRTLGTRTRVLRAQDPGEDAAVRPVPAPRPTPAPGVGLREMPRSARRLSAVQSPGTGS